MIEGLLFVEPGNETVIVLDEYVIRGEKRCEVPGEGLVLRRQESKKQLKVKNWLLLLARMLILAMMALALAQPSLNSETTLGSQEVATALALVVDTSMSMEYSEKGSDRLAEAKARATEILKRSTDDSEVFLVDSADPIKPVATTTATARKRVESLALRAANRPLNAVRLRSSLPRTKL